MTTPITITRRAGSRIRTLRPKDRRPARPCRARAISFGLGPSPFDAYRLEGLDIADLLAAALDDGGPAEADPAASIIFDATEILRLLGFAAWHGDLCDSEVSDRLYAANRKILVAAEIHRRQVAALRGAPPPGPRVNRFPTAVQDARAVVHELLAILEQLQSSNDH